MMLAWVVGKPAYLLLVSVTVEPVPHQEVFLVAVELYTVNPRPVPDQVFELGVDGSHAVLSDILTVGSLSLSIVVPVASSLLTERV